MPAHVTSAVTHLENVRWLRQKLMIAICGINILPEVGLQLCVVILEKLIEPFKRQPQKMVKHTPPPLDWRLRIALVFHCYKNSVTVL